MKRIPPPCPEPESGQTYWRSLDHLADSPEFHQWVDREFPEGASEFRDPVSRRHFLKIMSASFLLAGLGLSSVGCRRPEELILPFAKQPEDYVHGVAKYFATAMPTRGSAIPLLAKAHENRPVKLEGNPKHPDSNGGTNLVAQASLLSLYDPDRATRFAQGGTTVHRTRAMDFLDATAKKFTGSQGQGLCFLMESSSSPSRERLQKVISAKFPKARWFVFDPVDLGIGSRVASKLVGKPVKPLYQLNQAKAILSLDCDFIGSEEDNHCAIRDFAQGRKISQPGDSINRLYVVEGLMTQTGLNADHRLRAPTGSVVAVAAALASQLVPDNAAVKALSARLRLPTHIKPEWISECATDLKAHGGASIVLAGHRQPEAVHALALIINQALGNMGKTMEFIPGLAEHESITELAKLLNAGQVDTLVVLGGNPVYNAPADLNWAATQAKAKSAVIRLGYEEDETFAGSTWHLPATHYLETWGDARTREGTYVSVQPLLFPIFNGLTELEVLARVGGLEVFRPHQIVRDTFKGIAGEGDFEENWKQLLHEGFWANSAPQPIPVELAAGPLAGLLNEAMSSPEPTRESLELVIHQDYKMDDGRWNNNGWLQELPDPVTKVTWEGVVLVSRRTAESFGLRTLQQTEKEHGKADLVEVELNGRSIKGPAWIQPGMADFSVGIALGYGRQKTPQGGTGRVGHQAGKYNAYELRASGAPHFVSGAKLRKTGESVQVSCTQEHGSMEGRPIIREANAEQFNKFPEFAKNMGLAAHSAHIPQGKDGGPAGIYEHPYNAYEDRKSQNGVDLSGNVLKSDVHQWGMSVDLNACVGCAACVMACQSENNIPIVGKDQVWRNREMHWLRIDRYYSGAGDKPHNEIVDDPQAVMQPMMCQHCESAPCETVCPVNATVHDEEGLNVMAYNRCVGTRYCSNNCAYKVRRFNFFDYNRRTFDQLTGPFYPTPLTSFTDGEWNLKRWFQNPDGSTKPEDEWEFHKLGRNPDVTVRMRGVMEKCTFCVQRIAQAKITQKNKAGQSGEVQVPDGAFQTACQQSCPAEAIVFGNVLDPNSQVSQLKQQGRDYSVLGFLDTRPRVTYLARVRNPNPRMPDYHEIPLNIKAYADQQIQSPFEPHEVHHAPSGEARSETKGAH